MTSRLIAILTLVAVSGAGIAFVISRGDLMPYVARVFSTVVSERRAKIERGIKYGLHPRLILDVYRPSGGVRPKAAVLFLYGGGWRSGSRAYYGFVGAALAAKGYAAVIPDYRLFPEVSFPVFEEDAAQAYAWMAKDVASGGVPIFVAGHSAGAHIGALLVYDDRYRNEAQTTLPDPAGFIGLSGPYAFDPRANETTADIFRDPTPGTAQPINAVKRGAPPALLIHGSDDKTVGIWNTRELTKVLARENVAVQTFELESLDHLGPLLAISWPFRARAPVLDRIIAFIDGTVARKTSGVRN